MSRPDNSMYEVLRKRTASFDKLSDTCLVLIILARRWLPHRRESDDWQSLPADDR